jgi:polygalacturonase
MRVRRRAVGWWNLGRYVTGGILLKTGVVLRLDKGAEILGNPDVGDYALMDGFVDATGQARGYALIGAVDAKDVGIEGEGMIDGQGRAVIAAGKGAGVERKPFLVRWVRCGGVTVTGVTMRNSAAWTMHVAECGNVDIEGVKIEGHAASNNDGIDIDSSERVRVRGCVIDTGDDAICLKTTTPRACRDVVVEGCTLTSRCGAIKLGTESLGDFEDVTVKGCHILGANLAGIKLLSVDGGHIRHVRISDITMDSGHVAIFMRLGARLRTFRAGDAKKGIGEFERCGDTECDGEGGESGNFDERD